MEENTYTWAKLKEFVNSLPEDALSGEVIWWGDEVGGKVTSASTLEEDYVSIDGEPMEPYSSCEDSLRECVENDGGEPEDYVTLRMPKGTPILETY